MSEILSLERIKLDIAWKHVIIDSRSVGWDHNRVEGWVPVGNRVEVNDNLAIWLWEDSESVDNQLNVVAGISHPIGLVSTWLWTIHVGLLLRIGDRALTRCAVADGVVISRIGEAGNDQTEENEEFHFVFEIKRFFLK